MEVDASGAELWRLQVLDISSSANSHYQTDTTIPVFVQGTRRMNDPEWEDWWGKKHNSATKQIKTSLEFFFLKAVTYWRSSFRWWSPAGWSDTIQTLLHEDILASFTRFKLWLLLHGANFEATATPPITSAQQNSDCTSHLLKGFLKATDWS